MTNSNESWRSPRNSNHVHEIDLKHVIQQAKVRWLRPPEIGEILQNYQKYDLKLSPVAPNKPTSGSLFLFDRNVLRYFRKDGHNWRKKNDGKTVREAHERLKIGSVDVIHCYYAHGEDNPNFQRRSYWMLEGAYEHIVLVHYLEVTQGSRLGMYRVACDSATEVTLPASNTEDHSIVTPETLTPSSRPHALVLSPGDSEPEVNGPSPSGSAGVVNSLFSTTLEEESVESGKEKSVLDIKAHMKQPSVVEHVPDKTIRDLATDLQNTTIDWSVCTLSQQPGFGNRPNDGPQLVAGFLRDSYPGLPSVMQIPTSTLQNGKPVLREASEDQDSRGARQAPTVEHITNLECNSLSWAQLLDMCNRSVSVDSLLTLEKGLLQGLGEIAEIGMQPSSQSVKQVPFTNRPPQTALEAQLRAVMAENALRAAAEEDCLSRAGTVQKQFGAWNYENELQPSSSTLNRQLEKGNLDQHPRINKQDSFVRWCNEEGYVDDGNPLLTLSSNLGPGWVNTLEEMNGKEDRRGTEERQMDMALNVSMLPVQKFSIQDFSPDWGFAFEESKVLVNGKFLKSVANPYCCSWSCMFGEVQVPAEIVNDGVLRCKAPPHTPGRVPFYVTCGERLACSEIREFEFRMKSDGYAQANTFSPDAGSTDIHKEESRFQIRLARMLFSNLEDPSSLKSQRISYGDESSEMSCLYDIKIWEEWNSIERMVDSCPERELKEQLLQMLVKQKLQEWLLCKINEEERGASVLNGQGQGLLHLVAALDYDWAISPILAAGVNVNSRDQHGWTALHYAAAYGREKAILALLAAGAAAGPLTDPTTHHRDGRTPADLASATGHRGIAAFLAEMALTMHLKSLTLKEKPEDQIYAISADWEGENAVQSVTDRGTLEPVGAGSDDQTSLRQSLRAVRNAAQTAALIRATFRQHSFRQREELSGGLLDEHGMSHSQVKKLIGALKLRKIFDGKWKNRESAATKIQRQFRGWKRRKEFLDLRQRVIKIQALVRGHQVRKKYKKILWSVGVLEKAILRWRRKRMGLRNFRAEIPDAKIDMNEGESSDEDDFLKEGRKQKELAIEKAVTRVTSMVKSSEARAQYVRLLEGSHRPTHESFAWQHDLHNGVNYSYDESSLQQQDEFDMSCNMGLHSDPRFL